MKGFECQTEHFVFVPRGDREPQELLSRGVTQSVLCFGKITLVAE